MFLKFLQKKLMNTRERDQISLSDCIELQSLRIQMIHSAQAGNEPVDDDITLKPSQFKGRPLPQKTQQLMHLSDIIDIVNQRFGYILNEQDKISLFELRKYLFENPEIYKYMSADNTRYTKLGFFSQKAQDGLINRVLLPGNINLYKKIVGNPMIKNFIFNQMYNQYESKYGLHQKL